MGKVQHGPIDTHLTCSGWSFRAIPRVDTEQCSAFWDRTWSTGTGLMSQMESFSTLRSDNTLSARTCPAPGHHKERYNTTIVYKHSCLVAKSSLHTCTTPTHRGHTTNTHRHKYNGFIYISLTGRIAIDSQFLQRRTVAETGQTGLKQGDIITQEQLHLLQAQCSGQTGGHFGPVLCGGLQMQDKTVPNRHTLVITDIQATCTRMCIHVNGCLMGKHCKEVENDSRKLLSICVENDFRTMKPASF